ncbi:c-type cytochrome biogenesis protein CcsB [Niveibacterium sp. 24ML]|uniref:c-type cytochrome biogenesis protein CcsB n=1 Tax=Niveibacterium sp. 24ML TaxID=2985512 RepID=UPI00226F2F5D|nr:c-type cytochrome biogenesis protein CcsB [Niveibacterium sp. 24ML]MCX9155018.1 c-type cytochrome biogenesis protein CcsB [Niveibacterium sp. 24ML]
MSEQVQSLPGFLRNRRADLSDWLAILALSLGAAYAMREYGAFMDVYEKAILVSTVPVLAALFLHWRGFRNLVAISAATALLGISLYQHDLARAEQVFWLKYFFSSQTSIAWMSALVFFATGAFWLGLLARAPFAERAGSALTWASIGAGLSGMLVRWYESYLIGPDVGHIPVSNLYEVFVLFVILTGLLYLYYERHYTTRKLGAFVMLIVSAAVGFLLWYSFTRDAHEIQPLIPALQSYWMKIHVPANFIGYGAFAIAAMVGLAYLFAERGVLASRLPSLELLDDVMYRAIAIGFAFFTVATILGALWAAEAWGTYWQWDPKETWALIVWLNYAAWLHMRLTKGLRGAVLAWWAVVGLLVTTFAFLGVNMFLSGLHSYGSL